MRKTLFYAIAATLLLGSAPAQAGQGIACWKTAPLYAMYKAYKQGGMMEAAKYYFASKNSGHCWDARAADYRMPGHVMHRTPEGVVYKKHFRGAPYNGHIFYLAYQ